MTLRNAVLALGALALISIARPISRAALDAARAGSRLLAVFTQKDVDSEAPALSDLHPVGCAAEVLDVIGPSEPSEWIVLRGVAWIRLEGMVRSGPHWEAKIAAFVVDEAETDEVRRLTLSLRERVRAHASSLPEPESILALTERMNPRELADAAVANAACSVEDEARYAGEQSLAKRLDLALDLVMAEPQG